MHIAAGGQGALVQRIANRLYGDSRFIMLLALVPIIHTQLQMVTLTMMALAMSEDSIRLYARRDEIIDALGMLTEHIKEVQQMIAISSWPVHACTCLQGSNG